VALSALERCREQRHGDDILVVRGGSGAGRSGGQSMTFEAILDQAVAMLQRLGQVTYRTLKRQFNLDDAALEDLKDQLLFSHPVIDQAGRGLVSPTSQILGTARCHQPHPPVAVPGQAPGGPRFAGAGVRLVHRGV
jgi:hypothetical protein